MEEASTEAPVWLGVTESPTPHEAPEGGVDQAGFELAPRGEPFDMESREPVFASDPAPPPVHDAPVPVDAQPPAAPAVVPATPTSILLEPLRELAAGVAEAAESALPLLERLAEATQEAAEREAAAEMAAEAVPPEPPAAAPAGGEPVPPGAIVADRQSDATSKERPLEVKPGRPLAGRGLDIRTVRPKWPVTVTLLSVPRNPTVDITFGRTGRVLRASFVFGQDTGYPDVDGPLLDAVYRWTATGRALAELPADDPDAGVTLRIRIIIR